LVDADGKPVTDADFPGKFLLVYFGYTHCADQCPTALTAIVEAIGAAANAVQPIFITVDPERDRGPMLRQFTAAFDPRIVGLTGSPEQVAAAAKALHID
jgi:protein SCO1/2